MLVDTRWNLYNALAAAGWKVEFYRTARGDEPAVEFVESLEVKPRQRS
jgi:hypothetical protein